jgi:hypothetical protein
MHMMMMQMYFTSSTHATLWLRQWETNTDIWYARQYLMAFFCVGAWALLKLPGCIARARWQLVTPKMPLRLQ